MAGVTGSIRLRCYVLRAIVDSDLVSPQLVGLRREAAATLGAIVWSAVRPESGLKNRLGYLICIV